MYTTLFACKLIILLIYLFIILKGIIGIKEFEDLSKEVIKDQITRDELIKHLNSRFKSRRQNSWCCKPSSELASLSIAII